jgi:hypothetical protein
MNRQPVPIVSQHLTSQPSERDANPLDTIYGGKSAIWELEFANLPPSLPPDRTL